VSIENMTKEKPEQKICQSCGEPFGCGAKLEGCWCSELRLPEEVTADLKAKYQDCLCQKCLSDLASAPAMIVTYPNGTTEVVIGAVRVDTQNFHEGMFDFYDAGGNLLAQIDMGSDITWESCRNT